MKKIYLFIIGLLILIVNSSEASNVFFVDSTIKSDSASFISVEEPAIFPGGTIELIKFINKNLLYPKEALNNKIEGKVMLSFIIEKDGSVSDPKIIKGIGYGCDEEAIRIINSLPKFIPAKQNGNPVRMQMNLPVIYRLDLYKK